MKLGNILGAAILCLTMPALYAQPASWRWSQQDRTLNPSGLAVMSYATQFNVRDWNNDGKWDFIINNSGTPALYLAISERRWERQETIFPSNIGTFEFVDFDFDGDWDLATDGKGFWWNNGSNLTPVWMRDDSVLARLPVFFNLSFVDYDKDGDWDATGDNGANDGYSSTQFFLNATGGKHPQWVSDSSKVPIPPHHFITNASYCDIDNDGDWDVFCSGPVFVDPGVCNRLLWYENLGTLEKPVWKEQSLSYLWCGYYNERVIPNYQVVDFDNDGDSDVVTHDTRRHLGLIKNLGSPDSLKLGGRPTVLWGPITVESNTMPFAFDYQNDGAMDLIINEDFQTDFFFNYYHEARVLSFVNEDGAFDVGSSKNEWFKNPYPLSLYNFANRFHLTFSDFDRDGDSDYLFSYYKVSARDTVTGSRVIYFRNHGSQTQPNWIADSLLFAAFDLSPERFWAPQLIDIDRDGDDDLFIKKGGAFVFYENTTSGATLQWREQPAFMPGIASRNHYLATFADLTHDGLPDLIFGNEDGTLAVYVNVGSAQAPAWRIAPETFAALDFGENAAPAFADMDRDGRLDLFVGNRSGELYFYRNESTVSVVESEVETPRAFELYQSYPNPFNPEVKIVFGTPHKQRVLLKIFDLLGRLVTVLFDREVAPGRYEVVWNGKDLLGRELPSGTYLYRLEAGEVTMAKRMTLVR